MLLGCLIKGIYKGEGSYLRECKSNVVSFLVSVVVVVSLVPVPNQMLRSYLRRGTVIKIFTLFRETGK